VITGGSFRGCPFQGAPGEKGKSEKGVERRSRSILLSKAAKGNPGESQQGGGEGGSRDDPARAATLRNRVNEAAIPDHRPFNRLLQVSGGREKMDRSTSIWALQANPRKKKGREARPGGVFSSRRAWGKPGR